MTEALKLSSPGDLAAAVPYLLGFTPTDSVVAVAMTGRRLLCTMRIDIDIEAYHEVCAVADRHGADKLVFILYSEDEAPVWLQVEADVSGEVLQVRDGEVRSLSCAAHGCGDDHAESVDTPRVAAEAVFRGLTTSASRDDLLATLAPLAPAREAIELASEWQDIAKRDAQWMGIEAAGPDYTAKVDLYVSLARRGPDDAEGAALWFLAGWALWRHGDGVRAAGCVDRCLTLASDYSAALLLQATIQSGANPRTIPALTTDAL